MQSLRNLVPLLVAAGILLAGNGLQATLVALRASQEGFSATTIGLMGTTYYLGYISAVFLGPRLIRSVGHIRVFAALASLAAAGTLLLILIIEPISWMIIRCLMGFCFCGLFIVIESWLNESAANEYRARVLSIYRLLDFGAVTGIQFLLPLFGTSGFEIFAVTALLFCLSLVPISLSERNNPKAPAPFKLDLLGMWRISPVACLGCMAVGLTTSAFRLVGPYYATEIGFDVSGVALFMSAGLIGGAVLQYPFGWMSDRVDRRWVLMLSSVGAALAGYFLSKLGSGQPLLVYLGAFLFGALALPLHSISVAHANDMAQPGQFVVISAGLLFFFAIGSMVGPLMASMIVEAFGPAAFFKYTSAVHLLLVLASGLRLIIRPISPGQIRRTVTELFLSSPGMASLAFRSIVRSRKKPGDGDS